MMTRIRFQNLLWSSLFVATLVVAFGAPLATGVQAQEAAPSPTPAGATSAGMYITVISPDGVNIRTGPHSLAYGGGIGFLNPGDTAPALGRSPGGDWIQIAFSGGPGGVAWVYSPYVSVSPGTLRIIEPPPTPVPTPANTLDPTLAAQFNTIPTATRLPTFTPPAASLVPQTFPESDPSPTPRGSIPLGMMILTFISIGSVGFLLSLLGRR